MLYYTYKSYGPWNCEKSIILTLVHQSLFLIQFVPAWYIKSSSTVDSRYLDPSYLDPITYVELISKSRLFSLCIYCISASRMSNYFYVDTSAISSIIFSPWIYFSQFLLPRISNSDHDDGKQNVRCGATPLSVNENHNRPLIDKSIF